MVKERIEREELLLREASRRLEELAVEREQALVHQQLTQQLAEYRGLARGGRTRREGEGTRHTRLAHGGAPHRGRPARRGPVARGAQPLVPPGRSRRARRGDPPQERFRVPEAPEPARGGEGDHPLEPALDRRPPARAGGEPSGDQQGLRRYAPDGGEDDGCTGPRPKPLDRPHEPRDGAGGRPGPAPGNRDAAGRRPGRDGLRPGRALRPAQLARRVDCSARGSPQAAGSS